MSTESLTVPTAVGRYPIHFSGAPGELAKTVDALRSENRPVRVLSDTPVLSAQGEYLERAGIEESEILALPSGEPTKSTAFYERALRFLAQGGVGRDGAVFAFGGGVIGDLAGFAAATYQRGIDFFQIPTTLLAMVDSSVGGKTGINLPEGKNLVGSFWPPKAVFIDPALLRTVSARQFNAGMAEVIKYGLLDDASLFQTLEQEPPLHAESPELPAVIRRCCEIKARIVAEDEKETAADGGRALLNLGHTFAHAIENVAGYGHYLHGEAVGTGLCLAARLSSELGDIPPEAAERVRAVVGKYGLPVKLKAPLATDRLLAAMRRDKKQRGGKLRFVTLAALGHAQTRGEIDPELVHKLWKEAGAD